MHFLANGHYFDDSGSREFISFSVVLPNDDVVQLEFANGGFLSSLKEFPDHSNNNESLVKSQPCKALPGVEDNCKSQK